MAEGGAASAASRTRTAASPVAAPLVAAPLVAAVVPTADRGAPAPTGTVSGGVPLVAALLATGTAGLVEGLLMKAGSKECGARARLSNCTILQSI